MEDYSDESDCTDDLDPRVQDELDMLNSASKDINRLENEIDEARSKYRTTFSDASHKMAAMGGSMKKNIQRARQYYQIKEAAVQAQSEALRAARQFQTANGVYRAAKETIALAEQKLMDEQPAAMLSSAWQEMLNHATIRVMEAEREKTRSEKEHQRRSTIFANLEMKLHYLEKKFKRSIVKSRPYFEMKAQLELQLQQQKQNIDDLQNAIKGAKKQYSESLNRLEGISEEIHESRRQKILLMFPREPGVGADAESVCSSISEPNLDRGLFSNSTAPEEQFDSDNEDSDDVFCQETDTSSENSCNPAALEPSCPPNVDEQAGKLEGDDSLQACQGHSQDSKPLEKGLETLTICNESTQTLPSVASQTVNNENSVLTRERRECGSGAEETTVCGEMNSHSSDNLSINSPDASPTEDCISNPTGSDVTGTGTLPERENQTEGSSDLEELPKDLKASLKHSSEARISECKEAV